VDESNSIVGSLLPFVMTCRRSQRGANPNGRAAGVADAKETCIRGLLGAWIAGIGGDLPMGFIFVDINAVATLHAKEC